MSLSNTDQNEREWMGMKQGTSSWSGLSVENRNAGERFIPLRKCGHCGTEFSPYASPHHPRRRFCSKSCYNKHWWVNSRARTALKYQERKNKLRRAKCKSCGTEFDLSFVGGNKKGFCSDKCRRKARDGYKQRWYNNNKVEYWRKLKLQYWLNPKQSLRNKRNQTSGRQKLGDWYIRTVLQQYGVPRHAITKELIDAKRTHLLFRRLLKEKRNGYRQTT